MRAQKRQNQHNLNGFESGQSTALDGEGTVGMSRGYSEGSRSNEGSVSETASRMVIILIKKWLPMTLN